MPQSTSVFYPEPLVAKARDNARHFAWAREIQQSIITNAQPWLRFSDDELWEMVFGPTITRSWMVWSNGYCPACHESMTMYNWKIDAFNHRWKVSCPHCQQFFPKNDFEKFYQSGLDEHGVFEPSLADRSLLFNVEHPDADDPLHRFGVDDGEGYVEGENRWRFIGAYLIYGQWKQLIVAGVRNLAAAYVMSRDPVFAHRAAILLDRVADLYPDFDFGEQAVVYEVKGASGYVSTWHDACEETRELALAYDQIIDTLPDDDVLVAFLSRQARRFKLDNSKATFEDIRRNIEGRILRDALGDHKKIHSNYPRKEMTLLACEAILGWETNRERIYQRLDDLIAEAVAVDGVTGEKGLTGYSTIGPRGVAEILSLFTHVDPTVVRHMFQRHPRLNQTFRFHIDTWRFGAYYPNVGDCGSFASPTRQYVGATFSKHSGLSRSMFTFFWHLYELTGDPAYIQVLYRANGNTVDGLPHDLFAEDPIAFQQNVQRVIDDVGTDLEVGSINKTEWHLAILRSRESALWLHYDAGGRHSHRDGMNLGLFAKGLDLMPDFGYPPVQYGGWGSPKARWYTMSAAHNTVVVDGQEHRVAAGVTRLWIADEGFRAVRASGAGLIGGQQFERTVALVDLSDEDVYVVDVFRVIGGKDHAKFFHSHFGEMTTVGLDLKPANDYGHNTHMRHFRGDETPKPGWYADWKVDDRYGLLSPGAEVHVRYTDLTSDASAFTAEGWISVSSNWESGDTWIPRLMVRRQSDTAPLISTFVAVVEPYEGRSKIGAIRRLPLVTEAGASYPDTNVAVEIQLADGRRDLFVALDTEDPLGLKPDSRIALQPEWDVRIDRELFWTRRNRDGTQARVWK